jgi:hypothetical protein
MKSRLLEQRWVLWLGRSWFRVKGNGCALPTVLFVQKKASCLACNGTPSTSPQLDSLATKMDHYKPESLVKFLDSVPAALLGY